MQNIIIHIKHAHYFFAFVASAAFFFSSASLCFCRIISACLIDSQSKVRDWIRTLLYPLHFGLCLYLRRIVFSVLWHGLVPFDRHLGSVWLRNIWYYVS